MKAMIYDGMALYLAEFDKSSSYEFLSETVDGYIEHIPMDSLGQIDMWGNEEAKLIGLEPTLALTCNGKIYDIACGKLVFTRHDGKGGTTGLRQEDINFLVKKFEDDGITYTDFGVLQVMKF